MRVFFTSQHFSNKAKEEVEIYGRVLRTFGRYVVADVGYEPKLSLSYFSASVALSGLVNSLEELMLKIKEPLACVETPIKLYVFQARKSFGKSAKDIEVEIGNDLERSGINVNLENPKSCVLLLLAGNEFFLCVSKEFELLEYLRKEKSREINRSEKKIMEAFSFFGGLKGMNFDLAIDLGASPGGWSNFLAKRAKKVIAIDRGYVKNSKDIKGFEREEGIFHIKESAEKGAEVLEKLKVKADILACDINETEEISCRICEMYAKFLKAGAPLLLTVKCNTRNPFKHVSNAKRILTKFSGFSAKCLPSNRKEVTILCWRSHRESQIGGVP
ncbi:MAG: SAM-dependent methyltransferase [Candidatus Micrarchaeaceae archaeon]